MEAMAGYMAYQQQSEVMDEAAIKRALFKAARVGNVKEFQKVINQLPRKKIYSRCKNLLPNQLKIDLSPNRVDPEGKSIIHHILLNANASLLDYLLLNDDIAPFNFGNISMEGNTAIHLALALVSVAKYRDRCI